ncbi:MAG TPA: hypothetical protein VFC46_08535 [Humisphaera sp.]|nr:hypothetical protein [Humisphaera sp.]
MNNKIAVRGLLALAMPMLIPVAAMAEPLVLEAQAPDTTAQAAVPQSPLVEAQIQNEKILVLPFQPVDPNEKKPWIGKSIQQSMVADLMALAPDHIVTSDQFAVSVEAAIALAHQNGARYVVAGGYLSTDKELRVTGQLLDAQTGKAVEGLKVTGDLSQVFHMEDGLAMQVRAKLFPASIQAPAPAPAAPQSQEMVAIPQPQQSATATAAAIRNDASAYQPAPYTSTYVATPEPTVYGADSNTYTYSPTTYYYPAATYDSGVYGYPDYGGYGYYPYSYSSCDYPYYPGFGFGLFVGGVFHHGFDRGGFHNDYGRGSAGHSGFIGHGSGFGGRAGGVSSFANRGGSTFSGGFNAARSSATPFRSQPFYSHSSAGGSMGAFRGGSSFHSFGGSGGAFHSGGGGGFHGGGGGGFHGGGGGGGHGGGGHR